MSEEEGEVGTKVVCKECGFSEVVTPDDDRLPADLLIEHGEETGHSLSLVQLGE